MGGGTSCSPNRSYHGVPPCTDLGRGTPCVRKVRVSPVSWMGYPPLRCELTDKLKILPSPILRMRTVIKRFGFFYKLLTTDIVRLGRIDKQKSLMHQKKIGLRTWNWILPSVQQKNPFHLGYYRPHSKGGEGAVFSLSVHTSTGGGGLPHLADGVLSHPS